MLKLCRGLAKVLYLYGIKVHFGVYLYGVMVHFGVYLYGVKVHFGCTFMV